MFIAKVYTGLQRAGMLKAAVSNRLITDMYLTWFYLHKIGELNSIQSGKSYTFKSALSFYNIFSWENCYCLELLRLKIFIPTWQLKWSGLSKRITNTPKFSIPSINYRLVILPWYILIVLDWHEQLEIFNTIVFIKCNYDVVDWLQNKSIILFSMNTYILSLFLQEMWQIFKREL